MPVDINHLVKDGTSWPLYPLRVGTSIWLGVLQGSFFLILFPHLFILFGGDVFVSFYVFERKTKRGEDDLGGIGGGGNNQILC